MKLREIPCPVFGERGPALQPGDCWFARPSTEAERLAALERRTSLQVVARYRWAWWSDCDRLMDDSEIAAEHGHRRPLIMVLPNGCTFPVTQPVRAASTIREWHRLIEEWCKADPARQFHEGFAAVACPPFQSGWAISGEGLALSLSPSIHYDPGGARTWHGYLTNGELVGC